MKKVSIYTRISHRDGATSIPKGGKSINQLRLIANDLADAWKIRFYSK